MSLTMDTDYGLPIPMHRPYIGANPGEDTPLPFRRELEQVTELTAENSMPYLLPKPLPAKSDFESLPLEIRLLIWSFAGLDFQEGFKEDKIELQAVGPVHSFITFGQDSAMFRWEFGVDHQIDNGTFNSVIAVNRSLRSEVLDLLLAVAPVRIRHALYGKAVFTRYHEYKPVMEHINRSPSAFQFLRHVHLGHHIGWRTQHVSDPQIRLPLVQTAGSIRFVADHCQLLLTLQIDIGPWARLGYGEPSSTHTVRFKDWKPIIVALKYVVQKCSDLETLQAATLVVPCGVQSDGQIVCGRSYDETRSLDLTRTPAYAREELVEVWFNTTLREVIECGTEGRHIQGQAHDLWRWRDYLRLGFEHRESGCWRLFRTTVLGEADFDHAELLWCNYGLMIP